MPADNAFWPIVHKRPAYQFEREVRLVAWPQRLIRAAQAVRPEAFYEVVADIAPPGYDVAVDPNTLVEAVVLAPQAPSWLVDLVEAITRRYGITALVRRSDLDSDPA